MTTAGLITMLLSALFVWTFFFVCMGKVLRWKGREEELTSLDCRPPDMVDEDDEM